VFCQSGRGATKSYSSFVVVLPTSPRRLDSERLRQASREACIGQALLEKKRIFPAFANYWQVASWGNWICSPNDQIEDDDEYENEENSRHRFRRYSTYALSQPRTCGQPLCSYSDARAEPWVGARLRLGLSLGLAHQILAISPSSLLVPAGSSDASPRQSCLPFCAFCTFLRLFMSRTARRRLLDQRLVNFWNPADLFRIDGQV
jgi:hypothetical protein